MPKAIPPKVADAHRHVTGHFRDNPTLAEISRSVGLSPYHLLREFLRCYATTPKRITTELQIAEAQRLLRAGVGVGVVSAMLGFTSHRYFNRRFKQVVGSTPSAWLGKEARRSVRRRRSVGGG